MIQKRASFRGARWSRGQSFLDDHGPRKVRTQTGRQHETLKKADTDTRAQEMNRVIWLHFETHWKQNHREPDPKQQCDCDANDVTKLIDANRTILIQHDQVFSESEHANNETL